MKKITLSLFLVLCYWLGYSQNRKLDSLNKLLAQSTSDTQKINLNIAKISAFATNDFDSAIAIGGLTIAKSKALNYGSGEAHARIVLALSHCFKGNYGLAKNNLDTAREILSHIADSSEYPQFYDTYGVMYSMQSKYDSALQFYGRAMDFGLSLHDNHQLALAYENAAIAYQQESNFPRALEYYQKALPISEQENDLEGVDYLDLNIAITFKAMNDTLKAKEAFLKAVALGQNLDLKIVLAYAYANLSSLSNEMNRYGEQYEYGMKAAALAKEIGDQGIEASSLSRAAGALAHQNKFPDAERLIRQSMAVADSSKQPLNIYQTNTTMGSILKMENRCSEAIPYFEKALGLLTTVDLYDEEVAKSYSDLSGCYEMTGDFKKSLAAFKTGTKISDSVSGRENIRKATELTMNYEFDKKEQIAKIEQQKQNDLAKTKQTALIGGLILTLILAAVAFNGLKNKRRANALLQEQKEEVQQALSSLKSTQAQLIQSEKMASLGELTAGIAHEILNPLNFVNNFSEVNIDLAEELEQEIAAGNYGEAKNIARDIRENEEKITHHGKRADAIVKGMLQHSRSGTGTKEPVNINGIVEECLRLSYLGFRAKGKSFQSTIQTDFDETIGKHPFIQQEIVRLFINLFNNAFYALNEKSLRGPAGYDPVISVSTKKTADNITVRVKDNGIGMPPQIIDKIFQPFFTTKPTGQGTGLGLSLSYDIVKAQGGEIMAESAEGEGSEFVIEFPLTL
jgi:two-component system, NtrC family, sensor kinase